MTKATESDDARAALLGYLKSARNFVPPPDMLPEIDQTCNHRIAILKLGSLHEYVKYLNSNPTELDMFFDRLLGSRCAFFRDEKDWTYLREKLLPALGTRRSSRDMRFWVVNCGSGQEAYSLAITLCEVFGESIFQERVKIFGTDADEPALQTARGAKYSEAQLAGLSAEYRHKYFIATDGHFVFRNELRSSLTFGRHVLNEDPVMSRMDLILCRDVLVHAMPPQQTQILNRMSISLRANGLLVLGRGEEPIADLPLRRLPGQSAVFNRGTTAETAKQRARTGQRNVAGSDLELSNFYMATAEHSPTAMLCLDNDNRLVLANARARMSFGLIGQDIGRPLKDLEISYRPLDLRSLLDECARENRPVGWDEISHHVPPGRTQVFSVRISPLMDPASHKRAGFAIQFNDVTELYDARVKLTTVNQQLQTANEELQSSHEELETMNEELQSSNEELETANEELQSTNEELETMNEELHSTNSELEAANGQQRDLADTVEKNGAFLNSILSSINSALIVLDEKLAVRLWNDQCRNLWGLRADEVKGHSLFALDIGLPVDQLKNRLREFLQNKKTFDQLTLDATNRRGKLIRCVINMTPFVSASRQGVVLLIDEASGDNDSSREKSYE